jgi:nitronate monooxygenase
MSLPPVLQSPLAVPVIGAPMFTVSGPELVIAQCRAGVIGSFPSLNARPPELLGEWLMRIRDALGEHDRAHPGRPAAPFAVNLIVHRSNVRLDHDLAACVEHRVPIVITSLGARPEVNAAIQGYGGIVLHDVINTTFARKAIEKGANGLIAVAAGAGGHAGTISPFALVEEIRQFWDGPLVLSGSIATGRAVLAAQAIGADFAYVGSAFIATHESNADPEYKAMIAGSSASDVVYSDFFSGVHGNYLKPSIARAGLDPDNLPRSDASRMNFAEGTSRPKAWKDIWGCGQGIGAVREIVTAAALVERLAHEYRDSIASIQPRLRPST